MRHHIHRSVLLILLITPAFLSAQGTISGPGCAKSGFEYQYLISFSGKFKSKSEICITGGNLVDSKTECTLVDTFAAIKVIWDPKATKGKITFSSAKGNALFDVTITDDLNPGSINARKSQLVDYNSKREQIVCTPATGGSCNPVYEYQWEVSEDALEWKEIKGATDINLANQDQQKRPLFYRRRVTEKTSGIVAYSDIASVYLNSISF